MVSYENEEELKGGEEAITQEAEVSRNWKHKWKAVREQQINRPLC